LFLLSSGSMANGPLKHSAPTLCYSDVTIHALSQQVLVDGVSRTGGTNVSELCGTSHTMTAVPNGSNNAEFSFSSWSVTSPAVLGGSAYTYSTTVRWPSQQGATGGATANQYAIDAYLPITVGGVGVGLPIGFQIDVSVNLASYRSYANLHGTNIGFYDSSFNPVYAWVESGFYYTGGCGYNTYVKMDQSIPYGNTATIYLGFLSPTVNNFNSNGYMGASPLSTVTYGQYDNGVNVFNLYDNFASASLNTNLWQVQYQGTGSCSYSGGNCYSVSNGLTTTTPSTQAINIMSTSTFSYDTGQGPYLIFEWESGPDSLSTGITQFQYGNANQGGTSCPCSPAETFYLGQSGNIQGQYSTSSTAYSATSSVGISDSSGNHLFSVTASGSNVIWYEDYSQITSASETYQPAGAYFGAMLNYKTGVTSPTLYYARIREFLLSNPTATLGSLTVIRYPLAWLGTGNPCTSSTQSSCWWNSVYALALNDLYSNKGYLAYASPIDDGTTGYTININSNGAFEKDLGTEYIFGHPYNIETLSQNQLEVNQSVVVIPTIYAHDDGHGCKYDSAMNSLLSSSTNKQNFISAARNEALNYGYGGWQFDYEWADTSCLAQGEATNYPNFLNSFGQDLHRHGLTLTIDVYPCMGNIQSCGGSLDYTSLSQEAGIDYIMLEGYTNCYSGCSGIAMGFLNNILNMTEILSVPVAKLAVGQFATADSTYLSSSNNQISKTCEHYLVQNSIPQTDIWSERGYWLPTYQMQDGTTWQTILFDYDDGYQA
jgi:hypothetical protein